jgi:hypothetical protein
MSILLAALLVASALLAQTPQTPKKTAPAQGPPPRNLKAGADGHITANQDPANPDKFEVRVVKQGDTLSGIAGEVLKNPRLWPQLWEQNEHIINPHWIYPNDKVLIRPVTTITEAKPPEPPAEPVAEPSPPRRAPAPPPAAPETPPAAAEIIIGDRTPVSEVKFDDLYCSGFLRTAPLSNTLKVISRVDATGGVLAIEADYVYLSQGSEEGIQTGSTYQVVRPTRTLNNPYARTKADRALGMHYLDVAQLRVMVVQPHFSVARVIHNCSDAVEVGDILTPFQPIVLPARTRPRSFSPMMQTTSGVSGMIVASKSVLLNFGSTFKLSSDIRGVGPSPAISLSSTGTPRSTNGCTSCRVKRRSSSERARRSVNSSC